MADKLDISIHLSAEQAAVLCFKHYNIQGKVSLLPGEVDHNYKIDAGKDDIYIFKINRPDTDPEYLDYQEKLLLHIQDKKPTVKFPQLVKTSSGEYAFTFIDDDQQNRSVRLLQWIPGRLWSSVNPHLDGLRFSLGEVCGEVTNLLQDFNHPKARRVFDWDIAQASWTYQYIHLFTDEEKKCIRFFTEQFDGFQPQYQLFRKSVIHNDANDNNIIVSNDLVNPVVETIIDYGDAAWSQTINDVAVAIAYAVMDQSDPLAAALPIVSGYHKKFPLLEEELKALYLLVAIRLVLSVTKSAINKEKEPGNAYLQISEKPAWALLYKWKNTPASLAYYSFRKACGFSPVPEEKLLNYWIASQHFAISDLFPGEQFSMIQQPDLSIGSLFLGNFGSYQNDSNFLFKIQQLKAAHPATLFAGGYLETRPVYSTDAFKIESNNGPEYRTYHLGIDFWLKANTPLHAVCDGEIVCCINNMAYKDYGPTIIIKHTITPAGAPTNPNESQHYFFYTLYGHLSRQSLRHFNIGDAIKKGERIGFIGNENENGNWPSHLHFQIMFDLLGYDNNFPGVCSPAQLQVWSSICPDPGIFFNCNELSPAVVDSKELITERKKHLGKSLSLSYSEPLIILRGEMQYLISNTGRRYLDTVNNVAHVGHEHPRVVKAGQEQMAVLNTNTRYLHENILAFAKELCSTLPKELSVIHFVNSGSEANELAIRMAKAYTGQKDMIALEIGYHGNTNGCIDISSYKFDGKGGKGKPAHTHIVPLPDSYR
ncbi:MAG: aminotransferase class III-fold pyridoxal phosphate-dependent enzyme, partial [Ferruginibacter sp.]